MRIKFSDRPDKRIGDDAVWDKAEAALMQALEASGRPWTLNKGEGAFYGPKLEYVLRDAIGRDWQCGTVQVDLNLPGRLGAFYIDEHSNKVTPVMLHRAMFGSLERFIGILIEHYAGHLPLWLAPLQAVVATITSDADDYAREALGAARRAGLRAEADLRNEKINYKVREHSPRQGAGAARRRPQGGGGAHRVDPPARQREADGDAARRGARDARRRGGAAGRGAGGKRRGRARLSLHRHLELEAERPHHFQHGGEFRVSLRRQRLVEALAPETGRLRDLRHALGAGDNAESGSDQRRIAVLEHRVEILRDILVGLQICRGIPGMVLVLPMAIS